MAILVEPAPAKVNLTLRVAGRRGDGLHEIASLVAFAGPEAADTLTCDPDVPFAVEVTGPFAADLAGVNLVETAIALAREQEPALATGAFVLSKRLPVAAGIGGGSADAGAALRLLRRLNPSAAIDWTAIARRLGADVPVCFANRAAYMTGAGEILHPVASLPPLRTVLVNPRVAVPADKTAQVFRALRAAPLPADPASPALVPGPFADAGAVLRYMADHPNDLAPAARAVVPALDAVLAAVAATTGCRMARLSGGGPTCFGVYDTAHAAETAALSIIRSHPSWWVGATALR